MPRSKSDFATILPELHMIPLPTPFAVGTVNVYLIESDPLTLLDCGVNSDDSYAALTEAITSLGHSIEEIGRLIISHHHVDHMGAAARIVAASAAQVICHPYTVPFLETPQAVRERTGNFLEVALSQAGVPAHILDIIEESNQKLYDMMSEVTVAQTLDEGDSIPLAGRAWEVYHTPGHAGGMICLYDPASRVILSSDHLLAHISSNAMIEAPDPGQKRPRRLLDYIAGLRKIAALNPLIACTGHGAPVENVRDLIIERLAGTERRAGKLLTLFDGKPRTLYDLMRAMFPTVPDDDSFLTLSEVLGHLDLLETQGRIERDPHRDGIMYWKPVAAS